ncbi:MAG: hypothetical protein K2X97_09100 [Mycobacteriaceae bacterium]|nr:hypothetical protein [Mycobacteriaceae bacterium]
MPRRALLASPSGTASASQPPSPILDLDNHQRLDHGVLRRVQKVRHVHRRPWRRGSGRPDPQGWQTALELHTKDRFDTHALEDGCILGALHDRTKVSLINCLTTQRSERGFGGDEHYHFASVFPHFVAFGDEHITSADQKITKLSFHVDDAASLFYDFDAFGMVIDARPHIESLVEETKKYGREVAIGEHPLIFYFCPSESSLPPCVQNAREACRGRFMYTAMYTRPPS